MIFSKLKKEDYYFFVIIGIFIILIILLMHIQVVKCDYYQKIAEENYFRIIKSTAKRGIMYDKYLQPIVENVPSLSVYLDLNKIKDKEKIASFLADNLDINYQKVLHLIYKHRFMKFTPILIEEKVDLEKAIKIEEHSEEYHSLIVMSESRRNYLSNSHFIGYVGRLSSSEYKQYEDEYSKMDYIGKVGLEKYYERQLKGSKGFNVLQIDATGNYLGFIHKKELSKEAKPGMDLLLSIDLELQEEIEKLLPDSLASAAIVMDCNTGGIIATCSKPAYDPNMFVTGMNENYWKQIINNKNKPLLNKAYCATYPPGSVFKLVVAAYALEKGLVKPYEIFVDCEGGLEYGGRYFGCWKEEGHGPVNLLDAIRESCDTYFYELAKEIDLDEFKEFVEKCRLLSYASIDQINERKGFFPTSEWYNEHYSKFGWTRGHLLNLMIGQGEVLLTPLSIAMFYSGIANGGTIYQPHFVDYTLINGVKNKIDYKSYKLPIKQENIRFLKQALYAAVNEKGRTGGKSRVVGVDVGGKTGSAENYKGDTHAWFAAIAPLKYPEITVVVFVENGGSGADIAASLSGKIMAKYFNSEPILRY